MTPLMFGPPARQMLGIFHGAEGRAQPAQASLAVLVCPPFGQEAIRSQRLWRVLADRLARAGVPVLRFDYHGTGDSPGDDEDGELDGWQRDIAMAHDELRRLAGLRQVVWLGARLGGTLAALAARQARSDPSRVVMWDPVLDGPAYLRELRAAHVDALEQSYCIPDRRLRQRLARDPDAFTDELLGVAVSATLRRQLRELTPMKVPLAALHDTTVIAAPEDDTTAKWVRSEQAREVPVQLSPFKHPLVWTSDPHPNNAMVPAEALQRLLAELRE